MIGAFNSRVLQRVDFSIDSSESGKSKAILLQKFLREDDFPYASDLYRSTKQKFSELLSHAHAKEFNDKKAAGN